MPWWIWVLAIAVAAFFIIKYWSKIRAGRSRRYPRKISCSEFSGTWRHPVEYDATWEHVRMGVAQDLGQTLVDTKLSIDVIKYWHCGAMPPGILADAYCPDPETVILSPHAAQDEAVVAHEMTHQWIGNYPPLQKKYPGIARHPKALFEKTAWGHNPQPDPE